MILIGRYLSPFVRRIGATLHYYDLAFEQQPLRAGGEDQNEIRRSNPLGRVPVLVLDDGRALCDSSVIAEYLDGLIDPRHSLMPTDRSARIDLLSDLAIANGAGEKAIAIYSENARPEDKRHPPYVEGCARQARDGFRYLDDKLIGPWMRGDALSHLDLTVIAHWEFIRTALPELLESMGCERIEALAARASEEAWFQASKFEG